MADYNDEDFDRWLRAQPSPNLEQDPQLQQGGWANVRALMDKQAGMQYKAPGRFSQPVRAEEAPADQSWKTVLAMALDLFGNKGRGAGQIMMAGTDARNRQLADWRRDNSPRALAEREMQMAQLRNADRQGFEADRRVLGEQIGQQTALANAEQAQANNERDFDARAQQDSDRYAQASQFHNDSMAQQTAGREQSAAFHGDDVRLREQQMRQSAAQAAASQALQREQMNQSATLTREQIAAANERERMQQAAVAAQRAAAAQQHNTERQQDLSHQLSEETKDYRRLLPSINVARGLMDKYPEGHLPGVGMIDSVQPEGFFSRALQALNPSEKDKSGSSKDFAADNIAMQKARKDIIEFDLRNLTGANAPVAEAIKEELRMGGENEKVVRHAIAAFDDLLMKDFQSRASGGREAAMREVLAPYGRAGYIRDPNTPAVDALQQNMPDDPFSGINGLRKKNRTPLQ